MFNFSNLASASSYFIKFNFTDRVGQINETVWYNASTMFVGLGNQSPAIINPQILVQPITSNYYVSGQANKPVTIVLAWIIFNLPAVNSSVTDFNW